MREIKFRAWYLPTKRMMYGVNWLKQAEGEMVYMQYVGVDDCNGGHVYEGDILKFEIEGYREIGEVGFYDNGFWIKRPDGGLFFPDMKNAQIIGNIYENPDLLE